MTKPPKLWEVRPIGSLGDKPTFGVFTEARPIALSPSRPLLELMGIVPEVVESLRAMVDVIVLKNNLNPEQAEQLMKAQALLIQADPLVAEAY